MLMSVISPASIFDSNSDYVICLLVTSNTAGTTNNIMTPITNQIANVFIPFFNSIPPCFIPLLLYSIKIRVSHLFCLCKCFFITFFSQVLIYQGFSYGYMP